MTVAETMIRFVTDTCIVCGEASEVELTRLEFSMLAHPSRPNIAECLPERDLAFRELVKTGTHSKCWDLLTEPLDEGDERG